MDGAATHVHSGSGQKPSTPKATHLPAAALDCCQEREEGGDVDGREHDLIKRHLRPRGSTFLRRQLLGLFAFPDQFALPAYHIEVFNKRAACSTCDCLTDFMHLLLAEAETHLGRHETECPRRKVLPRKPVQSCVPAVSYRADDCRGVRRRCKQAPLVQHLCATGTRMSPHAAISIRWRGRCLCALTAALAAFMPSARKTLQSPPLPFALQKVCTYRFALHLLLRQSIPQRPAGEHDVALTRRCETAIHLSASVPAEPAELHGSQGISGARSPENAGGHRLRGDGKPVKDALIRHPCASGELHCC